MAKPIDTLLLFALPASGKSEVRRYMEHLTPEQCRDDFGMNHTLQLDDYPYVHFMHRIDDELEKAGWKAVFYKGPARPFQDDWTWAVLVELLNEDYRALMKGKEVKFTSAAQHVFDRLDAAHVKVGMHPHLGDVPWKIRLKVGRALEKECKAHLDALNAQNLQDKKDKTVVIEAARGAANGSAFPLTPPYGYDTAFQTLAPEILEKAAVLYIWVDPAESRRKNIERGQPNGQGSILHHSVPMEVMLGQYGCDDMAWLLSQSDRPGTIRVERIVQEGKRFKAKVFHLPCGRFDNREDKTSFIREKPKKWDPKDVKKLHDGMKAAFAEIAKARG